jgi:hypothetical protein
MTIAELAIKLNTTENRAAYREAQDKAWFIQDLIEAEGIATHPTSALCDFVEDALAA